MRDDTRSIEVEASRMLPQSERRTQEAEGLAVIDRAR
jgi:hypothetical protein